MNISPQISPTSSFQSLNFLYSGEIFTDSRDMAQERDCDRIDSFGQFDTSNYDRHKRQTLDESLHSYDASKEHGRHSFDSELSQPSRTVGHPKESNGSQSSISYWNPLQAELNWNSQSQVSNRGHKAFELLAEAKRLLNEQRIGDARSTLKFGARLCPNNKEITRLLRAVSPGQVIKIKSTKANPKREIAWLRQHGENYRGQWLAISGDELLASASTLKSVLEKLKQRKGMDEPSLIQYIVPE